MKKLLFLLLTLTIVICLASCDWFETKPDDEHEHTWEYVQYETGHYKQYTCGCASPDIMGEHCDNDGNQACDECGYLMISLDVDIEWQYSETHHWWIPASEGGVAIGVVYAYGEHKDEDDDCFCDVCGYDFTENVTPLGVFFSTLPGVEWLGTLEENEVAEIKMIEENSGVAPGSLKYISRSTNTSAIARILNEFRSLGVIKFNGDNPFVPGGQILTVEFILNDGTKKSFSFDNEIYSDTNGNHYFAMGEIPTFNDVPEYTMHYGFVSYTDTCEVWYEDATNEPYFVCEIPIYELEFTLFEGLVGTGVSEYPYFIKTEFGLLGFYSNDIFFVVGKGQYYELVGKNLDELIVKYGELAQ